MIHLEANVCNLDNVDSASMFIRVERVDWAKAQNAGKMASYEYAIAAVATAATAITITKTTASLPMPATTAYNSSWRQHL